MGVATLGNWIFRVDPVSIQWPIKIKSAYQPTIGGRVVQVYGAEPGDLTVSGTFGVGGWAEQEKFLSAMKVLAKDQINGPPVKFTYPTRGWDFSVYLLNYTDGGATSVTHSAGLINPRWNLTLAISENNLDIKTVGINAYLNRIARGLGWEINKYNGPMSWEEVQQAISAVGVSNVTDYFRLFAGDLPESSTSKSGEAGNYGVATSSEGGAGPGTEVFNPPPGKSWPAGVLSWDQVAEIVLSIGITDPAKAALMVAIAHRESGAFNSRAHNPNPPDNSWGLWQINVIDGAMLPQYLAEWRKRDLTDPWTNAHAMKFLLDKNGGDTRWSWTTNPDGTAANGDSAYDVTGRLPQAIEAVRRVGGG